MYIPNSNKIEDKETIFRFIRENPFAIIISEQEGKMVATHMIVEVAKDSNDNNILVTHLAKANKQWKNFKDDKEILIIFSGPHTYISSSWYDHINVPTWNYVAIHVYGKPKILNREKTLILLENLVSKYEKNSEQPFKVSSLNEKYLDEHLKALVAIEISIDRIDAKEKLSQNRNEKNYDLILNQLDKSDHQQTKEVAKEMHRVKKNMFKKN